MIREMTQIMMECVKHPNRKSVWIPGLGQYACPKTAAEFQRLNTEVKAATQTKSLPTINPTFKLVFLTSAIGTVFFSATCITLTLFAGKEPMPAVDRLVQTFGDMAKIGFGATVGLLGGQTPLGGKETPPPPPQSEQNPQTESAAEPEPKPTRQKRRGKASGKKE
jgi:hypothetical protein